MGNRRHILGATKGCFRVCYSAPLEIATSVRCMLRCDIMREIRRLLSAAWRQMGLRLESLTKSVNNKLDHMTNMIDLQKQTMTELYARVREETSALDHASSIRSCKFSDSFESVRKLDLEKISDSRDKGNNRF